MTTDDILNKILHQSQLTGIIAWIQDKEFEKKDMIVRKLNSYYAWSEINWEMYFQENKRNMAVEFKLMTQEEELRHLRTEVSKLKESITNQLETN